MHLLLVRHGETDHNAGQVALGRKDVPLNSNGRYQAELVGRNLASQPISAIYSSPLRRATETAGPLADALGLEIAIGPGLVEMDIGELDGRTFDDLRRERPGFLREWRSERVGDLCMPGGESLRQVQRRARAAVERIREAHPDEVVLAVSHNFVILTLLCFVMDIELAHFRQVRQDLGAVSILALSNDRRALLVMNDRCHLAGLQGSEV